MKYKIGDKVSIRKDLVVGEKYGNLPYLNAMKEEAKERDIVTIIDTGIDSYGVIWYEFEELYYSYSEAMIGGLVAESIEVEKFEKEPTDREKFEEWMRKLSSLDISRDVWDAFDNLTCLDPIDDNDDYENNLKIVADYLFDGEKKKMTKAEIEAELGYKIEIVEE